MVQVKGAVVLLLALVVLCIAHEACARPVPSEALGPQVINAAGRVLQQLRTLKRETGRVKGPANGIVNGHVGVKKGGNGAGFKSNCQNWNALNGLITAVNKRPGNEGFNPPTNPQRNYCEGVLDKFKARTGIGN